ncbi:hypothetical protein FT663_00041 [Candidozyma haemuli var. vulneris]|nr:hypothetical protein FT662_00207 [[Candida] haemuloni var. vulneris]KAF3995818.1 hypothetical protein FT663_00041 [[Candida] haemuloni var. vulneris]
MTETQPLLNAGSHKDNTQAWSSILIANEGAVARDHVRIEKGEERRDKETLGRRDWDAQAVDKWRTSGRAGEVAVAGNDRND